MSTSIVVAAGMAAALAAAGWGSVHPYGGGEVSRALVEAAGLAARLVVVADEAGMLPELPLGRIEYDLRDVIAVGGTGAARSLLAAVEAGVGAVVDGDQSLQGQVRALDRALVGGPSPGARAMAARTLRARVREEDLIATLTARELEVLKGLTRGESAADISAREVISMSTVRTHIRAVLRKLGVSSQLAAVALVHQGGWQTRQS